MAQLKIDQIRKSFGKTDVLKGVDLDIADGEFIVLLGASGCGKSTLLRIIAGLETQTSGKISIGGQVVDHLPPARRGIAMVFQSYALYPHLDVAGNWALGLKQAGESAALIAERTKEAARILALESLLAAQAVRALRRPAPACGDRPGDRAPPARCSCSTSHYPTSTLPCARPSGSRLRVCTSSWAPPWSTSPTTRWRP